MSFVRRTQHLQIWLVIEGVKYCSFIKAPDYFYNANSVVTSLLPCYFMTWEHLTVTCFLLETLLKSFIIPLHPGFPLTSPIFLLEILGHLFILCLTFMLEEIWLFSTKILRPWSYSILKLKPRMCCRLLNLICLVSTRLTFPIAYSTSAQGYLIHISNLII